LFFCQAIFLFFSFSELKNNILPALLEKAKGLLPALQRFCSSPEK